MTYRLRKGPCVDCGEYLERERPATRLHRCPECAKRAALDAADQMRNKCGPAWEKWLESREKALERQSAAQVVTRRHP